MAPRQGFRHTAESRTKMSETRSGRPLSEAHRAALSAALAGRTVPKRYEKVCVCGAEFLAATPLAVYCSTKCGRAARGHGRIHAPQFAAFPRECAICAAVDGLVGDHDHRTGTPRGVLCRNCNVGVGYFGDSPERLDAAAAYLRSASCGST